MEDNELKNLLKIDFPEIKGDEEKVLATCKARTTKHNKQLLKLTYLLSGFIVLAFISVLSIVILNNRIPSDVARINNSIINLDKIENDEEKMLEIMKIEKDIETIPIDKKTKIDMSKLSYETISTVNNLKSSVEWSELFVIDELYCGVELIGDLSSVSVALINENSLSPNEAYEVRINDVEFNNNFFSLVEIPYSEIYGLEDENVLLNMLRKKLNVDDYHSPFYVMYDIQDKTNIEFMIHPSGYIVITIKKVLEEMIIYKKYVSIVKVNYKDFETLLDKDNLKKYNLYKNYNTIVNVLNMEKLDNCSIDFLSISENSSSSVVKIIKDENDIDLIMSFIDNENVLFDKEIYYVNPYDLSCITIGIALKLSDGTTNYITCKISSEGVLKIKENNDSYIYYTDKNVIDYNALLVCIKKILYK